MACCKKRAATCDVVDEHSSTRKRQSRGKPIRGRTPKIRNEVFLADKAFVEYIDANIEIRDSLLPGAGKGAFWVGEEPLQPNKAIGVFDGEYIDEEEFRERYGHALAPKVFRTSAGTFIDGSKSKHWTVFVNDGRCDTFNNLRSNRDGRIITRNKVTKNTELLMSYSESFPWDKVFEGKDKPHHNEKR
jgi:hypothetical protein